jgi:hypothetical protein
MGVEDQFPMSGGGPLITVRDPHNHLRSLPIIVVIAPNPPNRPYSPHCSKNLFFICASSLLVCMAAFLVVLYLFPSSNITMDIGHVARRTFMPGIFLEWTKFLPKYLVLSHIVPFEG